MACPLPADKLKDLKLFIDLCKKEPNFLHHPDLTFFKEYLESLGVVILPKKGISSDKKNPECNEPKVEPEVEEVESAESDVELDYEGVIEPDNDPPQTMGYTGKEVTEEDIEKSNEKKRAAIELYSEQKYEEAINAYTEAILLNPNEEQAQMLRLRFANWIRCYDASLLPAATLSIMKKRRSATKHFLIERVDQNGKKIRRKCTQCYVKMQQERGRMEARKHSKMVYTYCSACSGSPQLCLPCFNLVHE